VQARAIAIKGFFFVILIFLLNSAPARAWEGVVTGTPDGDSLKVKRGGRLVNIRLYGIDSPEYGQSCWQEARGLTRALVLGKRVDIESLDTDQYGRIVALVRYQGQLLNSELVRHGLAWVYPRYCRAQPLCGDMQAMERAAKKEGLGFWSERAPLPPWIWKMQR
jgi:endonuclease YncB( thermonuclease family)